MTRRSGNWNAYEPRDGGHQGYYGNIEHDLREQRRQQQINAPGIRGDGQPAWKTDQERIADLEADIAKLRDIVLALIDEMIRK
jgi:hypothetical protein